MGREKEYRQRLKYQVHSVRSKTLEAQISAEPDGEQASFEADGAVAWARAWIP